MKTRNIKTALALGLMTAAMSAGSASAHGWGAQVVGAVRDVESQILEQQNDLVDKIRRMTGQLSGNMKEDLSADARMRQLEDERDRQREIERVKFEAMKNATSSKTECVIRTRAVKSHTFNRPEERVSAATLLTLEQLAAWNLGAPVGSSGVPKTYESAEEKSYRFLEDQAVKFCDPAMASAGLCEAPVEPKLQGANYLPTKSVFSSINYDSLEAESACNAFAANLIGSETQNIAETRNINSEDPSSDLRNAFSDTAIKQLGLSVTMGYCADRSPSANKYDASQEHLIASVKDLPGYDQAELAETGISYMMAFQIRSQEWYGKARETSKTEISALNEMKYILGWMSYQNNEIYKKLDKMTYLQGAQLLVMNEQLNQARKD